nr:hypothetical protein [Tanacetum cinerariifolium]
RDDDTQVMISNGATDDDDDDSEVANRVSKSNVSKMREKTVGNLGASAFGVSCDGSPKASNSSPLVSRNATSNMPRGLYNVDVAATFGIPLTTVGDLDVLIKDIAGEHNELLFGMINDKHMAIMDALGAIYDSIQAENSIPSKSMPNDHIMQSVNINTKATSYARVAGASAKDQTKVSSNFHPLMVDHVLMVSTCLFLVILSKRNKWAKHGLERIIMNTKGFFFFKFDTRVGLESVLEGGPWIIRNSPIILKKWSMDTRLLKEKVTRISIWVKLHDVPIQVFEEDGINLIAMFIGKLVMLGSYIISMCNDSWGRNSFARCLIEIIPPTNVEYEWRLPKCDLCKIFGHVHDYYPKKMVSPPAITTSNVVTPIVKKTNDGFQTVGKKKKRKGKSKSTNGGQSVGPSVKQPFRYEPKIASTSYKKDNITMSNSYSALNDEEEDKEEDVENVYDELANLFPKTKTDESSSFTAVAGLHIATKDAVQASLIRKVKVRKLGLSLSQFFYADDVVMITEWNRVDLDNIVRLLHIFCSLGFTSNVIIGGAWSLQWRQEVIGRSTDLLACSMDEPNHITRLEGQDIFCWNIGNTGFFTIRATRNYIDDLMLPIMDIQTRWYKVLHILLEIETR